MKIPRQEKEERDFCQLKTRDGKNGNCNTLSNFQSFFSNQQPGEKINYYDGYWIPKRMFRYLSADVKSLQSD